MSDFEKQYKELNAGLEKINDQIKAQAEAVNTQITQSGQMQAETREKVDQLLLTQGELQARLNAAEQALVGGGDQGGDAPRQTLGQRVVDSDGFDKVGASWKGSHRVEMLRNEITSLPGSAGSLVEPDRRGLIDPVQQRMTIRDLLAPGETSSSTVEYTRETGFTNNADVVAENTAKPYSDIEFDLVMSPVRTIAHLFKASRQILDDAPALRSYIDGRARYGLQLKEEQQLLFGDGTGQNLHGIVPQAQEFAPSFDPAFATPIDRIRLAMLQAALAEFPTDGLVLNPIDWARIELTKDQEGRYIIGNPATGTTPTLWNRPVVETQAMVANTFLTGAFRMAAQIFDRMTIEILLSTENADDFEKNMVSIRAEERLALAVYRPEAFVTGDVYVSGNGNGGGGGEGGGGD